MIILAICLLITASFILLILSIWEDDKRSCTTFRVLSFSCFAITIIILLFFPSKESKYNNCVRNYAISIENAKVSEAHEACKDLKNKIN